MGRAGQGRAGVHRIEGKGERGRVHGARSDGGARGRVVRVVRGVRAV